jgi:hypothetical protein
MKTIPFIVLILALTFTPLLAQAPTTPAPPKQKETLIDFRVDRTIAPPKIPLGTQRAILSQVFPRYLSDESKCNPQFDEGGSTDRLKAARDAGQIVPSIVGMANGSFTAPGQTQTAYVISVSECNASHAENYGTKRLAIFARQQLVANVDADFRSTIERTTDLNGDGKDELLMTSGDMAQGNLIETAALLEFQNGRLRVIDDFGTVTDDSCATETPGSSAKASVLSISNAVPGTMPKIRMDNYEASCRKVKRWRFLSTGKSQ